MTIFAEIVNCSFSLFLLRFLFFQASEMIYGSISTMQSDFIKDEQDQSAFTWTKSPEVSVESLE